VQLPNKTQNQHACILNMKELHIWTVSPLMPSLPCIVAQYAYQSPWYAYPYHSYPYWYPYAARLARLGGEGAGGYPGFTDSFSPPTYKSYNYVNIMRCQSKQHCTVVEAEKGKKKRLKCNPSAIKYSLYHPHSCASLWG